MAERTLQISGTFSLKDAEQLLKQFEAATGWDQYDACQAAGLDRYDYEAGQQLRDNRRFKGAVTFRFEEIAPLPYVPPTPPTE